MHSTQEKILNAALKLFNEKGLAQVSQRTIAEELGISPGNLTYHFKKREDIIEALYHRLVDQINQGMTLPKVEEWTLGMLSQVLTGTLQLLYTYRFFMIDFVQIMRANKTIKSHFAELSQQRQQQFLAVIDDLIQTGRMRSPDLPNEYQNLYQRFQIFGDFWVASTVVQRREVTENDVATYSTMLLQSLYPYLTEKGKTEFSRLR